MTKDEALKLALEALEDVLSGDLTPYQAAKTITTIREALTEQPAQHERVQPDSECKEDDGCPTEKAVLQRFWRKAQQQEPVAYMNPDDLEKMKRFGRGSVAWATPTDFCTQPVYTAPPASKPKNVMRVKRISDQSVELVFTSCAAASEFIVAHGIKGEQK